MIDKITLFTDADNTLWDTDQIFAEAQLGLLRGLEKTLGISDKDSEQRGLDFIRFIDQRIAALHPDNLRYPPALLAEGVAAAIQGQDPETAAIMAANRVGPTHGRHRDVIAEFVCSLERMPKLRPGVRAALEYAKLHKVRVRIVTESSRSRCGKTVRFHHLEDDIVDVISEPKSEALFRRLRVAESPRKVMMVGDQLDRDVGFAQAAGFRTFYFPSTFRPFWHESAVAQPDHEIRSYEEIIGFIDPAWREFGSP